LNQQRSDSPHVNSTKTCPEAELVKKFEAADVVDYLQYLQYLQSTKRILWTNVMAGIAKGFGITIGMSLALGIFVWILTSLMNLPLIGEYFESAEIYIHKYAEDTNYTDEFAEMNGLLKELRDNTENHPLPQ
jgi:hypothetical protein